MTQQLTIGSDSNEIKGEPVYNGSASLSTTNGVWVYSDPIVVPEGIGKFEHWLISLRASSSNVSAKMMYSISPRDQILQGGANWDDWDAGLVTQNTTDMIGPVKAVMLAANDGDVFVEVRLI